MRKIYLLALLLTLCVTARAQTSSVHTNALMWATGTINVGVDIRVHNNVSIDLFAFGNPIKSSKMSMQAVGFQPAVRYWFYETGVGPFTSVHGSIAAYDIGNKYQHYKGVLFGVGVSYGYNWILSKRWSVGVELGVSALFMKNTRRDYTTHYTDDEYIHYNKSWTVAPSKADVSFIYLF